MTYIVDNIKSVMVIDLPLLALELSDCYTQSGFTNYGGVTVFFGIILYDMDSERSVGSLLWFYIDTLLFMW